MATAETIATESQPSLGEGIKQQSGVDNPPKSIVEARQAEYIAFLFRAPFAIDAWELGFITGIREDYSLQASSYNNVSLDIHMLDNNFKDADLERYLNRFHEVKPTIGVIGDAYTEAEAERLNEVANTLLEEDPNRTIIIAPKCSEAFDVIDDHITLGYPVGYSDLDAEDFSSVPDWRGRNVHMLGGSPLKQWKAIVPITRPTIENLPPANIVGVDWNGFTQGAYYGEYWTAEGWKGADLLTIRETIRTSLREIRDFWQKKGVWPDTTPKEICGQAVEKPDIDIFMDNGGDPIPTREALENAHVETYEEHGTLAFESETQKQFIEYRAGLTPA